MIPGYTKFDIAARLFADLFPDRANVIDGEDKEMARIENALDEALKHQSTSFLDVERRLSQMAGEYERRFMAILGPELLKRREEQDATHGGPAHDDTHTPGEWIQFLEYYVKRANGESRAGQVEVYEDKLFDVAALAISAIQSRRRRRGV